MYLDDMYWFIKIARIDFGVHLKDDLCPKDDLLSSIFADFDRCCSAFEEQCLIENLREEFLNFQMIKAVS